MLRKLDSPVRSQMAAVAVFKSPINGEYHGNTRMEGKPPRRRRRIFVQTETGCVLGMELDRGDNVHTVKRKLHLALNVPTEESSLSFGDRILSTDLSAIGNDSALLLTRNFMHRSSSTPCLSPRGVNNSLQQRDHNIPVEILGCSSRFANTNELVKEITDAIKKGIDPIPVNGGLGGAYYFRNMKGEKIAIVKPTDEEPFAPNNPKGFVGQSLGQPGLKRSVRVGETGFREVAAYLLDYHHFANVPPTVLVKITHSIFNINDSVNRAKHFKRKNVSKIASLQKFVPHDFDASDYGTSSFPVHAVHRIGILDIRILNTDRHAGNLLVKKLDGVGMFNLVELIPIDHGLCLPEIIEDPYFEWIHWPQSSIPFSEEELVYINNLDPVQDSDMLRAELPMIRESCLRVLILCTNFLKEAASFGLCLAEIGEMMSREFRDSDEQQPSELEVVCLEARRIVAEEVTSFDESKIGHEDLIFDMDLTPKIVNKPLKKKSHFFGSKSENRIKPLVKLEESSENDEHELYSDYDSFVSKLSMSMNKIGLVKKSHSLQDSKSECGAMVVSTLVGARSANFPLPVAASFVNLADMNEEEWTLFLEKFKELLYPAFANRKSEVCGQRLKLRLGTSCRF